MFNKKKKNKKIEKNQKKKKKKKAKRKVRDGYGLYECTSVYVKGQKYPKLKQTYLGKITKEDGFIPKVSYNKKREITYIEYGLSHFILTNFKRSLSRSLFNGGDQLVVLGIIYYIFKDCNKTFIDHTYLSKDCRQQLYERIDNGIPLNRLKAVSNKIDSLLNQYITDKNDLLLLTELLMLCVVEKDADKVNVTYPEEVVEIVERYGLKL